MTCSSCGGDNPPDALFCRRCGRPLPRRIEPSAYRPLERQAPELEPKDVGEMVAEAFKLYQRDFRAFLLIASVPQVPLLLSIVTPLWLSVLLSLIALAISFLANGAIIHAVAQKYSGQDVNAGRSIGQAWNRAASLTLAYSVISLALLVSAILMFLIVGIPLFFYFLVGWFFAGQAIMIERKRPIDALERSRVLVAGTWWRVFGIGVFFALALLGAVIAASLVIALVSFDNSGLVTVLEAVTGALIFPMVPIGATLVYFDLRVRKEGYTLQALGAEVGL